VLNLEIVLRSPYKRNY